jgi:hypothetical protein
MRRKPNVEQRRRDLCDAAIELVAAEGVNRPGSGGNAVNFGSLQFSAHSAGKWLR